MNKSLKNYPLDLFFLLCIILFFLAILLINILDFMIKPIGVLFIILIPGYLFSYIINHFMKNQLFSLLLLSFSSLISLLLTLSIGIISVKMFNSIDLRFIFIILTIISLFLTIISFLFYKKTEIKQKSNYLFDIIFKLKKSPVFLIVLTLILLIMLTIALTPKTGEKFTEFYLLGEKEIANDYPVSIIANTNTNLTICVNNHEYKKMNYTIEMWLIDQSNIYNTTANKAEEIVNNMWFLDRFEALNLPHKIIELEKDSPQWKHKIDFNINKTGFFKLLFLLFTNETNEYYQYDDLVEFYNSKVSSSYCSTYLWINVK